jgi:hypothetical protein
VASPQARPPQPLRPGLPARNHLNQRRRGLGKGDVWLTRNARPLAEVVDDQLTLDGIGTDGCDFGWCLT